MHIYTPSYEVPGFPQPRRGAVMSALGEDQGWYTGPAMRVNRRKQMAETHQPRPCVYTVILYSKVNRGQPGESQNEGTIV